MLESQTDEVYFFQSRWLVFHLQCHYSLTEQLCAALVTAPPGMPGLTVHRQAGDGGGGDSCGALGVACGLVYTRCRIRLVHLHFNFSNLELNFNNFETFSKFLFWHQYKDK